MLESIKIADQSHAISFGDFYLKFYKNEVDRDDLKEVFRDWNINNQSSAFSTQNTKDFDPKLMENLYTIFEKVLKNSKKGDS